MPPLNVVVLTSGALGLDVGTALGVLPEVRSLAVVTTRVTSRQGPLEKVRRIYRYYGATGLLRSALGRLRHPLSPAGQDLAALVARCCPGATHLHCDDLHAPESLARLRALAPTWESCLQPIRSSPRYSPYPAWDA